MDFSDIIKNGIPAAPTPQPPPAKIGTPVQPQMQTGMFASSPYGFDYSQSGDEKSAGVTPPQYFSMLGQDGALKSPYAVDPSQAEAFKKMQTVAESSDLSPWAQLQSQLNQQSSNQQRDSLNAKTQGQTSQALSQLQSVGGGTGSGAAMQLAMSGGRSNIMGNQNIGAQELTNNLNIASTDAQNKQALLGQVANTETGALSANAGAAMQDTGNANTFSANRYNQLMGAWGSKQTADAQRAAAGASGGGKK